MRKNVLRTALVLISAAVMVYAAHRIYQEHSEYREGADSYSVLEAYIKEPQTEPMPEESKPEQDEMSENAIAWPVVDFAALESINSDCVAWIRIDETEICMFVNDVRPKRRKNNQVQRIVKRPAGVEREGRSEAEERPNEAHRAARRGEIIAR